MNIFYVSIRTTENYQFDKFRAAGVTGNANINSQGQGGNPVCSTTDEISQPSRPFSAGAATGGNYVELLHTLAAKYERLARHLETSTVFSGFSNMMQNGLIAAIGDVVRYDIKEISAAPFVAAEVAESTDVTNKAQISVIMWLKARWLVK